MAQMHVDPMHVVTAKIALVERGRQTTVTVYLPSVPHVGETLSFGGPTLSGSWRVANVAFEIGSSPLSINTLVCKSVLITAEQLD